MLLLLAPPPVPRAPRSLLQRSLRATLMAAAAALALLSGSSTAAPAPARDTPRSPGPAAIAAPTLGFIEDWPGTSLDGWAGGGGNPTLTLTNPGTGGVGGANDGYLQITSSGDGH